MKAARLNAILEGFRSARLAIVGDFCLDRYLEIDPSLNEKSIETKKTVYNVVSVRSQPGGAGTILNNLSALGVQTILPIGFCGQDGEGYELRRALAQTRGVDTSGFIDTSSRRTFTYCKPLLMWKDSAPEELHRLDSKNWSRTPETVEKLLVTQLLHAAKRCSGIVVMDQVDIPGTGVVTRKVLDHISAVQSANQDLPIISDSRSGLNKFPRTCFKMNLAELVKLTGKTFRTVDKAREAVSAMAIKNKKHVFVTMASKGAIGASPNGETCHHPGFKITPPFDVVGAGDSVTALLIIAMSVSASLEEMLELAMMGAAIVLKKLGTTGTVSQAELLRFNRSNQPLSTARQSE
ncbi:MAG: hldE [Verrucomicrobiales bacterium]|nr:hldE [Verrucomicrobiales bacterium]